MKKFHLCQALVALLLTSMMSAPLHAQDAAAQREEASRKINVAGRQRMLSQRMVKGMCFSLIGVDAQQQAEIGFAAAHEFVDALAALREGSDAMGLGAERDTEILAALSDVAAVSKPLTTSVMQIVSGDPHSVAVALVLERNVPTLRRMNETVGMIVKASAGAALSGDVAHTVNLAGRQRMLSQKIAKDACLVAVDLNRGESLPALKSAVELFDTTLSGLRNGDAAAGLLPPPNDAIAQQLHLVEQTWRGLMPDLETVTSEGDVAEEKLLRLVAGLDVVLVEMNRAVGMWVKHAG